MCNCYNSTVLIFLFYLFTQIQLASVFSAEAAERIKTRVRELEVGAVQNNDDIYSRIADAVVENKGYVAEHPLTRTFW